MFKCPIREQYFDLSSQEPVKKKITCIENPAF